MYPQVEILQEIGRVTIAGARLEREMGALWAQLDQAVDPVKARRALGAMQSQKVKEATQQHLWGDLQGRVLRVLHQAETWRRRRNEVVHQDWLLTSRDATRPVSDFAHLEGEERRQYADEWRREAKASPDWERVPNDSLDVAEAQGLHDLCEVERGLSMVTDAVSALVFAVASARLAGAPPGWRSEPDQTTDAGSSS